MSGPSNILVIKLCCVGDVVMLTPALRSLRRSFPSARISYLAASWVKDVVEQTGFVDEIIEFDAPYRRGILLRLRTTLRLLGDLRRRRFDAAVIAHRRRLFALIALLSGIGRRIGFGSKSGLLVNEAVPFDPASYEIDRYLALVRLLGAEVQGSGTEMHPDAARISQAGSLLQELGLDRGDPPVAFFPGGGENPGTSMTVKRWSPGHYARLAERVLAEYPGRILFLGGLSDEALIQGIIAEIHDGRERTTNLAGWVPFGLLPAFLRCCALVVGGDSGTLHLAAAVGVPTLFLFGPSDPRLVAPRMPNVRVLWKHPACSPCYTPETILEKSSFRGNTFICRTGTHECLEALTVDEVLEAVVGMMSAERLQSGNVHASS